MGAKKDIYKKIKDKPTVLLDRIDQLEELVDTLIAHILENEREIAYIKNKLDL